MAAFEIDERKLRRALPVPTSSTMDDAKWSAAFLGMGLFWLAWVAVIGWLLVRGLLALL